MEDDLFVRLSGQSPLRLLDHRLDELALPKHGTKLDTWTRIEKRENELMRAKITSRAAIEAEMVQKDAVEKLRSRPQTHVNRRTQRRKLTSSVICHHSHGANSASEEEVRRILLSG